jgi:2-dehydropantoate 2-reductase
MRPRQRGPEKVRLCPERKGNKAPFFCAWIQLPFSDIKSDFHPLDFLISYKRKMASVDSKPRVLLIGGGGIGAVAALNLELGYQCTVTAVLRGNYDIVKEQGFIIRSLDYGNFNSWRPSGGVLPSIPNVSESEPYDYITIATKNLPDIPPTLPELIKPAVTPGHSVIVLIQNGLNIEKPLLEAFPNNVVLSGISLCGAYESPPGTIVQNDRDRLSIGPFFNPNVSEEMQMKAAEDVVRLYAASGKSVTTLDTDVPKTRWRKLLYNSTWNPVCALTGMDTSRLRFASDSSSSDAEFSPLNTLVRPAMREIIALAKIAANITLEEELVEEIVQADPIDAFLKPSMLQDVEKGRPIEYENILGEVLREARRIGAVEKVPTIRTLYGLCRAYQWRIKERRD